MTYVTAGDPDLEHSRQVLLTLARAGADVLEVGVPFSDPLADGPVIQRATERALAAGTTLAAVLDLVASVRGEIAAPIVLFTYANPLVRMGVPEFATRAAAAGVDGVLTLDLPVEEAGDVRNRLHEAGLDTIFLLSPTTTTERIRRAAALGSGFLYGISRLGVTGARQTVASGAEALVAAHSRGNHAAGGGRLRHLAAGARVRGGPVGRCRRGRKRPGQRHRCSTARRRRSSLPSRPTSGG